MRVLLVPFIPFIPFVCMAACATPPRDAKTASASSAATGPGDTGLPVGVEAPVYSGSFTPPDRDALASLDLPPGPDGTGYTLIPTATGTLWIDPTLRDPVTAAGACASLVAACLSPDERNIHGCLVHGGTCASAQPWDEAPCCPAGCVEGYRSRRTAGSGEIDALLDTVYTDDQCIPGISGVAGGGR